MFEFISRLYKEIMDSKKSFEKDGRTKDCFYYDKNQCRGNIKNAHSLQRNGVLNIVEAQINGNMVVYCFQRMEKNPFDQYLGFEKIGKGNASTFFGFCDKHDTEIFQPIENNEIDISNDQHKFLLCYRAAARTYHRKVEQIKSFENNPLYNTEEFQQQQIDGINGSKAGLAEMEEHRTFLNSILQSKNYSQLRYFTHTVDYTVPIACTSVMSPSVYIDDQAFNLSDDLNIKYEHVYLTVVPTKSKTHILYACLPGHVKSMKFIDDLESLTIPDLESVTCSLMVNEIENGFISPAIFEELSKGEQDRLIQSIELSDKIGFMFHRFYHLGFNFFEPRFQRNSNS